MEEKTSANPKTVKMFRRLERFLDDAGLVEGKAIDLKNAETGRVFATFVRPESFRLTVKALTSTKESLSEVGDLLLEGADAIDALEAENDRLLDIIDLQNEVLQGRAALDEVSEASGEAEFAMNVLEGLEKVRSEAGDVIISAQEYEELLNLRKKRERDHKQLSSMDAKLKEYKKNINSLQSSRDTWHARADENYEMALGILNGWREERGLDPFYGDFIAFTADVAAARGL